MSSYAFGLAVNFSPNTLAEAGYLGKVFRDVFYSCYKTLTGQQVTHGNIYLKEYICGMDNDAMDKERYHINCYYGINRLVSALNLWSNGYHAFVGAKYVNEFERFKNTYHLENQKERIVTLMEFAFERIIDDTRVIICFENFMKGILLTQGYLAHVPHKRHKLHEVQKQRPIAVEEVLKMDSYRESNLDELDITEKSVSFRALLTPAYQEVIKLPPSLVDVLSRMYDMRNELHFLKITELTGGPKVEQELTELIDFARKIILGSIQNLNDDLHKLQKGEPNGIYFDKSKMAGGIS